jgi:uncharacterized protein YyaL (SSP411 family)
LSQSVSPYLLQHQDNPVDWYPWGDEALSKARREDKPILLSIGYATCHWCHVMERDAFSVEEVAALLNEDFVSIKVDREERPDLDALYQGVVQLQGRGGGWPLTVFLTPDCRPFFGGTYFPPEDAYGLPSFRRVLTSIAEAWKGRRAELEQSADSFAEGLGRLNELGLGEGEAPLDAQGLARAARGLLQEADREEGGFLGAPKFPRAMELSFLLRLARLPLGIDEGLRGEAEEVVRHTLEKMAAGGILDRIGGGFHRYAVDASWTVPHFEKMLTDNALLLRLYAEAARATGAPSFAGVAEGIARWILEEMRDPSGAFRTAEDADSEGVEGKFYVWTREELLEALGPDLGSFAADHWGVTEAGNFEGGASVLVEAKAPADEAAATRLEEAREKLLLRRLQREAPSVDDKILASANGLAIGALAAAGRFLDRLDWIQAAAQAAEAVRATHWDGDELQRSHRGGRTHQPGFLDDYALLAEGLVELFESTGELRWLAAAAKLGRRIVEEFWDEGSDTFYLSPARGGPLHRVVSAQDNALPSGASSATMAFLRLHALTGDEAFGAVAEAYLRRQADRMEESPFAYGHLLAAAALRVAGLVEAAVLGPEGARRDRLLGVCREGFRPQIISYVAERGVGPLLSGRGGVDGEAAVWICRGFACERPRTEPDEVREALGPLG